MSIHRPGKQSFSTQLADSCYKRRWNLHLMDNRFVARTGTNSDWVVSAAMALQCLALLDVAENLADQRRVLHAGDDPQFTSSI